MQTAVIILTGLAVAAVGAWEVVKIKHILADREDDHG